MTSKLKLAVGLTLGLASCSVKDANSAIVDPIDEQSADVFSELEPVDGKLSTIKKMEAIALTRELGLCMFKAGNGPGHFSGGPTSPEHGSRTNHYSWFADFRDLNNSYERIRIMANYQENKISDENLVMEYHAAGITTTYYEDDGDGKLDLIVKHQGGEDVPFNNSIEQEKYLELLRVALTNCYLKTEIPTD